MKITRALLSVSEKKGLLPFARALVEEFGVQLLSTGGTAKLLQSEGVPVTEVSDFTGFPEMLGGRVKTLHPMVHGGLLFKRDDPDQVAQAAANGILPIDLVVVNLYPFEATVAKPDVTWAEAIENIDIGGPSMLRSAAKNHAAVTVVSDPEDYDIVLQHLRENAGSSSLKLRERLAVKAFEATSHCDRAIATFLNREQQTGGTYRVELPLTQRLRYGENPHQEAALYGSFNEYFQKLHGKELSFNNILDVSAASALIGEFDEPVVAILKHTNPCGVGTELEGGDLREAWDKAFATDRQAPFGGIIIVNRPLTEALARAISEIFSEVIIAPEFTPEARALLQKKKNLRLMRQLQSVSSGVTLDDIRSVPGGILVQEPDSRLFVPTTARANEQGATGAEGSDVASSAGDGLQIGIADPLGRIVTHRAPTEQERRSMTFGWKIVKHVKSNAIVYAAPDRTLGIGAGQMSRIDASRLAVIKAKEAGLSLEGSAVASDAFFPFPDALLAAAEIGATAAIQPGGSVRDPEVIASADERGLAMIMTGIRHFKH